MYDANSLTHALTYLLTNLLKGWQVDVVLFTKKCGIRTKNRYQKIELYQLWINLPERDKYGDPAVTILRNESIPVYCDEARNTFRVICGSLSINDEEIIGPGNSCTSTPLAIIQVKLKKVRDRLLTTVLACLLTIVLACLLMHSS